MGFLKTVAQSMKGDGIVASGGMIAKIKKSLAEDGKDSEMVDMVMAQSDLSRADAFKMLSSKIDGDDIIPDEMKAVMTSVVAGAKSVMDVEPVSEAMDKLVKDGKSNVPVAFALLTIIDHLTKRQVAMEENMAKLIASIEMDKIKANMH